MDNQINNDDDARLEFHDWASYLQAFDGLPKGATWGDKDWAGTATIRDAVDLGVRGWPDGLKHVHAIALPVLQALPRTAVGNDGWGWDVTGADYDVGEYVSGTPECWLTNQAVQVKPVIRILVNIAVSCGVPVQAINTRGEAVAALCLRLQEAGFAVDLWTAWGVSDRWVRARVSDPNGGPLDLDRVLFATAHPAAGRQLGHGMIGEGVPCDGPPWESDLYLPAMHIAAADWKDNASVVKWVETTYNKLTSKYGNDY